MGRQWWWLWHIQSSGWIAGYEINCQSCGDRLNGPSLMHLSTKRKRKCSIITGHRMPRRDLKNNGSICWCNHLSTTPLYDWINCVIMRTKNIDLSENLGWRTKSYYFRQTFAHWEIDTVIGEQHKQNSVLLTLVERQTWFETFLRIDNKDDESVY